MDTWFAHGLFTLGSTLILLTVWVCVHACVCVYMHNSYSACMCVCVCVCVRTCTIATSLQAPSSKYVYNTFQVLLHELNLLELCMTSKF